MIDKIKKFIGWDKEKGIFSIGTMKQIRGCEAKGEELISTIKDIKQPDYSHLFEPNEITLKVEFDNDITLKVKSVKEVDGGILIVCEDVK